MCIDSIERVPPTNDGREYLVLKVVPRWSDHAKDCEACRARLKEATDHHVRAFLNWGTDQSCADAGERNESRWFATAGRELQLQLRIATWVWLRDGHIPKEGMVREVTPDHLSSGTVVLLRRPQLHSV